MTLPDMTEISGNTPETAPWLTIVGVGEDGWDGLCEDARNAIETADLIVGGERHLRLINTQGQETKCWGKRLKELIKDIEFLRGRNVCILASGNPLFYGVGSHFARALPSGQLRIIPQLSILSQVCTRLAWPETDVTVVTLCGRPLATLNGALFNGARLLILCAGENNAGAVAKRLWQRGFGESRIHVFDYVGGPREKQACYLAREIPPEVGFSELNTLAVHCVASPDAVIYAPVPGLPDEAYDHDGQLTKSEVRAITLARLSPRPGQLLWDIGGGAGSIGIEWMRSAPDTQTIAIERRTDRAERIKRNADRLGVPRLCVEIGDAPAALKGLAPPDAIFIGGGLSHPDLLQICWQALKPAGRLVINAVTLESEAILLKAYEKWGGDLTKIAINRADPVGPFHGWRPAMPVTQWAIVKPGHEF